MANHELMHGHNLHFALGHNHNLVLGQNHALDSGQAHDPELGLGHSHEHELSPKHGHGEQYRHEIDLVFGQNQNDEHDNGLVFDQDQSHERENEVIVAENQNHECQNEKLSQDQNHDHENEIARCQNHSDEHENEIMLGQNKNHKHTSELVFGHNQISISDDHDHVSAGQELALVEHNHDLVLHENHDMSIMDGQQLDRDVELTLVQNQEMGIDSSIDMVIHQPELIVTPVIQARALVPNPNHELVVGQEFPDVQSCRRALREAAIALHFEIQTVKSDKTRFTAKCASAGCPWRIHAAKLPGVPTFTIRTINESHTCGGITHLGHQQASVQWVANSVEQRLRENPHCKPKEILEEIHRVHGITLSYKQAWRGKERIMAAVRGSFEEGYRLLPQYCDQVKRTNPGSIASVYGNPTDNCFRRLFVSFQASIFGFVNACRPILGLDRTLLKSKYLGTLLFATGFDGDGALFPLAFGVVDEENDDHWMWFLSELHNLLEINTENMPRLTILSDRQKGIVDGVEANFPTAFHGFCMRHLSDSFRNKFNDTVLVTLLWEAAYALTVMEFEAKILEMEDISAEAAFWIRNVQPRLWATAYFEGTRFGHLTAKIVESLNSWILEASGLPIIQMMECIRRQLMTWFNERRETSMQWNTILVPSAERHLSIAMERASSYHVVRANDAEFEIVSHEGTNIVDVRSRCCLCRGWQLYGIPCAHAVAALLHCRQNVHRYTESCFTVANYRKAYKETIHPIPDKSLWKELSDGNQNGDIAAQVVINPPKSLRPQGRPRKKRARVEEHGRAKRVVHCSRCNQTGHFRTTCTAPI